MKKPRGKANGNGPPTVTDRQIVQALRVKIERWRYQRNSQRQQKHVAIKARARSSHRPHEIKTAEGW
jgi:hypothetical protein